MAAKFIVAVMALCAVSMSTFVFDNNLESVNMLLYFLS
jgi:hypothetical protein